MEESFNPNKINKDKKPDAEQLELEFENKNVKGDISELTDESLAEIEKNNPVEHVAIMKALEKEKRQKDDQFKAKQIELSIKYNILHSEEIELGEDGEWYFHGMTLDEYNELMSGNDNSDMYNRPPNYSKENNKGDNSGPRIIPFDPLK